MTVKLVLPRSVAPVGPFYIMAGGGSTAGRTWGWHTVSTLQQRSTLLSPPPLVVDGHCHRDDSEWRGLGQCLLPATVSPGWRRCRVRPVCTGCWAWTDVALFSLCYTTIHSTLCYYVTLPHLANCVTLSHCHMHTVSCYNTHTVLYTEHTCTYGVHLHYGTLSHHLCYNTIVTLSI